MSGGKRVEIPHGFRRLSGRNFYENKTKNQKYCATRKIAEMREDLRETSQFAQQKIKGCEGGKARVSCQAALLDAFFTAGVDLSCMKMSFSLTRSSVAQYNASLQSSLKMQHRCSLVQNMAATPACPACVQPMRCDAVTSDQ